MKRIFALLATGMLVACGGSEQVAGGGSDQPNKIGSGRILTDSGTPAGGVKVQSWSGTWDPQNTDQIASLLDSGVSDTGGAWKLRIPDTGSWFVVGRKSGYIAVCKKGQIDARLQAVSTYHGNIQAGAGLGLDGLWLGGEGGLLALDGSGNFSVVTQPGPHRLWAKLRLSGGWTDTVLVKDLYLSPGDNSDSALVADTGIVLLASSESSPLRSALRGLDYPATDSQDGQWYTFTDQYLSGTSLVQPIGFPTLDSALVNDVGGRYFSWQFQLGDPLPFRNGAVLQPIAAVGIQLSRRDLDWSGVEYLRIVGRGGQGVQKVNLQVSTTFADRLEPGSQFQYTITLPTDWTTILVPLDSLEPAPGSEADSLHLKWSDVSGGVHDLAFFSNSQVVRLELREIRAIGNNLRRW
jgi:hypothetical protein